MTNSIPALPSEYLQWLRKLPELHVVRFQKNEWQFWTEEELQETTRVNKLTSTHIGMMVGFVTNYRSMGLVAAKGPAGKPFPYEKLERCLVLATDNEDFLILNPDEGNSVRIIRSPEKSKSLPRA